MICSVIISQQWVKATDTKHSISWPTVAAAKQEVDVLMARGKQTAGDIVVSVYVMTWMRRKRWKHSLRWLPLACSRIMMPTFPGWVQVIFSSSWWRGCNLATVFAFLHILPHAEEQTGATISGWQSLHGCWEGHGFFFASLIQSMHGFIWFLPLSIWPCPRFSILTQRLLSNCRGQSVAGDLKLKASNCEFNDWLIDWWRQRDPSDVFTYL